MGSERLGRRRARRFRHTLGEAERVRQGHRQEGNGLADQDGRRGHGHPGRRLLDHRQGRGRVLRLRQRQRRHQRPPDQVHPVHRPAQPGAGSRVRQEDDRERQGRRHRRQHELRRVRRQLEVLQVQGLRRHRRRRPGGVFRHAGLRRDEHGPALQRRRRCTGARPRRREVAHRLLSGHDRGVRRRRSAEGRPERRHPGEEHPAAPSGHRRQRGDPAARAGGRERRRRHPRLRPHLGTAADEGGRGPGSRRTR